MTEAGNAVFSAWGEWPRVLFRTFYAAFAHATEWYAGAKTWWRGDFGGGIPNVNEAGVAGFVGNICCRIGVPPTRGRLFHALRASGIEKRQTLLLNHSPRQLLAPRSREARLAPRRVSAQHSSRRNTAAIAGVRELV